jgi:hypothetical protein
MGEHRVFPYLMISYMVSRSRGDPLWVSLLSNEKVVDKIYDAFHWVSPRGPKYIGEDIRHIKIIKT